jgi:hypothetical protein
MIKSDAIEYMLAWADLLTEEGKMDVPKNDQSTKQLTDARH